MLGNEIVTGRRNLKAAIAFEVQLIRDLKFTECDLPQVKKTARNNIQNEVKAIPG